MKIDYGNTANNEFYAEEAEKAIQWLLAIRDPEKMGWAWVQFIQPNEQNTAEVISTFVDYIDYFADKEEALTDIVNSINYWLLNSSHPKISIDYCWVLMALQKVRSCQLLRSRLDGAVLSRTIIECLNWICSHRNTEERRSIQQLENSTGIKGCGWGDNEDEISNTIRTSLAVLALNREISWRTQQIEDVTNRIIAAKETGVEDSDPIIQHLTDEMAAYEYDLERYKQTAQNGIDWLLSIQNSDGGWGNLDKKSINREYEEIHSFSFSDLQYQCDSNAACTGYAMVALSSDPLNRYASHLRKALGFMRSAQGKDGKWDIFVEIGIRDGVRYTFRHFGTTWAIQGLIRSGMADYTDECIIKGFEYLTTLQDENYGGWKSSSNADNYTWATCNALDTIKLLKDSLSAVKARQFLRLVCEWWEMKKREGHYYFQIGNHYFAFNGSMCCLYCIVFSVMITLLLYFAYSLLTPLLAGQGEFVEKMVYSVLTVSAAIILGLPWIVFVKNVFHKEIEGWIDSIGWVYGIITGFVLVFYQFIM